MAVKIPVPEPRKIVTLSAISFAPARSGLPSRSKSAVASAPAKLVVA
ncbi:MAG: hypothetical protein U0166_26955 [Acidobacteriota bacterium]